LLKDKKAIEIVSRAKQKNVRDPRRSREHFERIFRDFLSAVEFSGNYLDMGPGQYDFCEMARSAGATKCFAMENDPAVIELGEYLGFEVIDQNIKNFGMIDINGKPFSGIFNKFSYNAFWFIDQPDRHEEFVRTIDASLSPSGWSWIAPWNGVPKKKNLDSEQIEAQLLIQRKLFGEYGFEYRELTDKESKIYGVHGAVANNPVFTKNL